MGFAAFAVVCLVASAITQRGGWWSWLALAIFLVGFLAYFRLAPPRGDRVDVTSPVAGRWTALNSPTSRVPSHGVHAWAQTYAIDLVCEPADGRRPPFGWLPLARRPTDFPGFGAPVRAPVSGVVVRAHDRLRDHWTRTSPLGLVYFVLESVRELLGPLFVLGNHVVIRGDTGVHILVAHLRRGSLRVGKGDAVSGGDVVGECGNSGNSTEPHVHLQAMDSANVWVAAALPLEINGSAPPRNGELIEAADGSSSREPC